MAKSPLLEEKTSFAKKTKFFCSKTSKGLLFQSSPYFFVLAIFYILLVGGMTALAAFQIAGGVKKVVSAEGCRLWDEFGNDLGPCEPCPSAEMPSEDRIGCRAPICDSTTGYQWELRYYCAPQERCENGACIPIPPEEPREGEEPPVSKCDPEKMAAAERLKTQKTKEAENSLKGTCGIKKVRGGECDEKTGQVSPVEVVSVTANRCAKEEICFPPTFAFEKEEKITFPQVAQVEGEAEEVEGDGVCKGNSGPPQILTEEGKTYPVFSPDGKLIYLRSVIAWVPVDPQNPLGRKEKRVFVGPQHWTNAQIIKEGISVKDEDTSSERLKFALRKGVEQAFKNFTSGYIPGDVSEAVAPLAVKGMGKVAKGVAQFFGAQDDGAVKDKLPPSPKKLEEKLGIAFNVCPLFTNQNVFRQIKGKFKKEHFGGKEGEVTFRIYEQVGWADYQPNCPFPQGYLAITFSASKRNAFELTYAKFKDAHRHLVGEIIREINANKEADQKDVNFDQVARLFPDIPPANIQGLSTVISFTGSAGAKKGTLAFQTNVGVLRFELTRKQAVELFDNFMTAHLEGTGRGSDWNVRFVNNREEKPQSSSSGPEIDKGSSWSSVNYKFFMDAIADVVNTQKECCTENK